MTRASQSGAFGPWFLHRAGRAVRRCSMCSGQVCRLPGRLPAARNLVCNDLAFPLATDDGCTLSSSHSLLRVPATMCIVRGLAAQTAADANMRAFP